MKLKNVLFYLPSFLASGIGFLAHTLVSGYWASAFSEDILHFSLNLAAYFLSLGVGSLLSESIKKPKLSSLYVLTILGALWLGIEVSLLKFFISIFGALHFIPILFVTVSGILAGIVVPLTLRVSEKPRSMNLSVLFFWDYTAAVLFSVSFTFIFLVPLGYLKTSVLVATVSILLSVLFLGLAKLLNKRIISCSIGSLSLVFIILLGVQAWTHKIQSKDTDKQVIFARQSQYQKIVLMKETPNEKTLIGDHQYVLYLDGFLQFSTIDEQSYHACIANIPYAAVEYAGAPVEKVLILGGGDGLAARNLLVSGQIKQLTLVELDPVMIEIAKSHPILRKHNLDSLHSPRVTVVNADAFRWVQTANEKYDLIIVDFPLPKNLALARLFTSEFYQSALKLLSEKGVMSIQAGPSFSYEDPAFTTLSEVTASIEASIHNVKGRAFPYISVLDNEAFILATNNSQFDMLEFSKRIGMLGDLALGRLCSYNPDWKRPIVEPNTLNTLKIASYMLNWIARGNKHTFFHYRGTQANFLPE